MSGAIFAALGPLECAAGASEPATAPFGPGVVPLSYQQSVQLPPVAPSVLDSLKSSPENNRRHQIGWGRPFAQPIIVNQSTVPISQWTVLPNGWSIWSAEVGSTGAVGLRIHIESLRLPKGARLIAYDPANPQPDPEPLTTQSLAGRREAWTGTLFSPRAIVECQLPPGVDPRGVSFVISGVSHLYPLPMAGVAPKEACFSFRSKQEHRYADAMLNSAGGCAEKQVRQEAVPVGAHRDQAAAFPLNPFNDFCDGVAISQFGVRGNSHGLKLCPNSFQIRGVFGNLGANRIPPIGSRGPTVGHVKQYHPALRELRQVFDVFDDRLIGRSTVQRHENGLIHVFSFPAFIRR